MFLTYFGVIRDMGNRVVKTNKAKREGRGDITENFSCTKWEKKESEMKERMKGVRKRGKSRERDNE